MAIGLTGYGPAMLGPLPRAMAIAMPMGIAHGIRLCQWTQGPVAYAIALGIWHKPKPKAWLIAIANA